MSAEVRHPDLQWFFPRPRLKDSDPDAASIREDLAEGITERLENHGLYDAPAGDQSIFVATIRALVQSAGMSPALARRKVFVVGDADRMVAQEGADQAANAFLKLLEEPSADTTIILTSSEPGALLPTIRSRVVAVRVPGLSDEDIRAFLADPIVSNALDTGGAGGAELVQLAGGAPGRLIGREAWQASVAQANRLLDAATAPDRGTRMRTALAQGASGARGKFSDTLDALTVVLHQRARSAAIKGNEAAALGAARAIGAVEHAKELAYGNVNPQLVAASLLKRIAPLVR
jgi:DNA polymerase-3 subunit delta'